MDFRGPAPRLEHVFDIRIDFKDRWMLGELPQGGQQGYTSVLTGLVEGPRLNGKVVDVSGADWAYFRPDGVIHLNAHYLLEADDGTRMYINNMGYIDTTVEPHYFRITPYFKVPAGKHDWLSKTVIVGGGERKTNPDHSIFRYWAVY